MKKLSTIFMVTTTLLLMSNVFAQSRYVAEDAWGFGFGFTYPRYISINDAVVQGTGFYGGHLTIQKNVSEHVGVRFRTSYNHVKATYQVAPKVGEVVTNDMITGDFGILYYFAPCEPWSPYLLAGAGINYYKPENTLSPGLDGEYTTDGQYSLGAGTEIRIGDNWRVKLEGVYNTVWSSNIDGNPGPSNGLIGGTANDTWVNADFGLLYYFSKGEPSKICQLYTGISEVDYDKIEDIVRRYQTEPTDIDYNRIEDIVKRHSQRPVQDNWTLVGVNFDFNKATLRPEAFPILRNAAEILLTHPDVSVDIVGHTDQVGSDKYNDKLSLQRAESVKKYLIAKGVDSSRLNTVGKGKRDLLFKENDPTSRFYNRRIEFRVK
jgi:outer membrane protein OmpA-like peptidoglycan-associated protein/opacity protein-like surface antigen